MYLKSYTIGLVSLQAVLLTAAVLATAEGATASEPMTSLASDTASSGAPVVPGGQCYGKVGSTTGADPNKCRRVLVLKHIDHWVYAGGIIDSVVDRSTGRNVTMTGFHNIFRFDAATGSVDAGFKPQLYRSAQSGAKLEYADSEVTGIASDGTNLFVAGRFTKVAPRPGAVGVLRSGVASLTQTGTLNAAFNAKVGVPSGGGVVNDVEYVGGTLWLGGAFSHVDNRSVRALAFVSPSTGGTVPGAPTVAGQVTVTSGTKITQMAVSNDVSKAAVIGNFTTVGGQTHHEVVVLDVTAGGGARVNSWDSPALAASNSTNCSDKDTWARGVDWSPDNIHFNVVASGGGGFDAYRDHGALCDAFTRFDSTKVNAAPDIVNNTGFDSLFTVADAGGYAYTGGHNKSLNHRVFINGKQVRATQSFHYGVGAIDVTPGDATYGRAVPLFNDSTTTGRGAGWASSVALTGGGVYMGGDAVNFNGDPSVERLAFLPAP